MSVAKGVLVEASRYNVTSLTVLLSDAVAWTETIPVTVVPVTGEVKETTGGVVSEDPPPPPPPGGVTTT